MVIIPRETFSGYEDSTILFSNINFMNKINMILSVAWFETWIYVSLCGVSVK